MKNSRKGSFFKASPYEDENIHEKVPEEATYSGIHFLMVFIGMWTSLAALAGGVDLGRQITPWKGALGILLGYVICMIFGLLVGLVGVKERKATGPVLERPFGPLLVIIPSIVAFLAAGIFIGVQADAVVRVGMEVLGISIKEVLGPITNRAFIAAILCAFMMFTAYRGFKYIALISWISMPLYLTTILLGVIFTTQSYPGGLGALMTIESSEVSFDYALYVGVSLYAGFSALMCDVARFVKNKRQFSTTIVVGYLFSSLIPIAGIIMGAGVSGEYWIVFASFGLFFGVFASISLFLAQWTTNDNNAFASGLAISAVTAILNKYTKKFPYLPRSKATLIPIVLGIILAFLGSGAVGPLMAAVGFLGDWLPTIAGVLIAHYYIIEWRTKKPIQCKGIAAVLAYLPSSLLCQFNILPWKAITGILLAMVLYVIFYYAIEAPLLRKKLIGNMSEG